MLIANPIYDVVFKYLLEDLDIARDLLSAILDEQIVQISVGSQEIAGEVGSGISVLRMDFKAIIQNSAGEQKMVLIELQKAKKLLDIMRFRRYVGENYSKGEEIKNQQGETETLPLPIITIYFLGFKLDNVAAPVLKIDRKYIDVINKTALPDSVKETFVEQLTHNSYIVQIPRLSPQQQTPLAHILQVFSQSYITADKHKLDYEPVKEAQSALVLRILERLHRAIASEEVRAKMNIEDEFETIVNREVRKKLAEKDLIIEEKTQMLEEKTQMLEEKAQIIEEKDQKIADLLAELERLKK